MALTLAKECHGNRRDALARKTEDNKDSFHVLLSGLSPAWPRFRVGLSVSNDLMKKTPTRRAQ